MCFVSTTTKPTGAHVGTHWHSVFEGAPRVATHVPPILVCQTRGPSSSGDGQSFHVALGLHLDARHFSGLDQWFVVGVRHANGAGRAWRWGRGGHGRRRRWDDGGILMYFLFVNVAQ